MQRICVTRLLAGIARRTKPKYHKFLKMWTRYLITYSQFGEDLWLMKHYINVPDVEGVVVEVGAFDGVRYSNSLLLEAELGCRVVLIEPAPVNALLCRRNRSNSSVWQVAAHETLGTADIIGASPVAILRNESSESYLRTWGLLSAKSNKCLTVPLSMIFEIEGLSYVDVLSVDVQGAELSVLRGVSFSLPIGCICIELDANDLEKDAACRLLMREHGFCLADRQGINEFWINPEYFRAQIIFNSGVNSFRKRISIFQEITTVATPRGT